ncbi:glycosyltransferase family 4 protein [Haloferax elongans]|uniref:glycosyltransferase family 4 protein n=1 Tax=Haloferax elongans TaxID=403191 RepID=UPI0030840E94
MPIRLVRTAYRQSIQQRIKNGLSDIDHVISISKLIKNILVSNTSLSTTDVTTIYNSVLLDSYPEPQSNTNNELLFVGSLKPQKGILEAIKSFSLISDRIQEYELIVAGDGRLRSDAEDLVAEFSLSRRVRFVGHVDRDTILQLYSQASVVLYPSVWPEPFGRVSIEAMASGTPIVGSKFGAIPEVLDDWPSSRIADPTDNEQFSQEILQVLDSDHAPKKLSKESVYSHLIAADKHEKLYVELNQ